MGTCTNSAHEFMGTVGGKGVEGHTAAACSSGRVQSWEVWREILNVNKRVVTKELQ